VKSGVKGGGKWKAPRRGNEFFGVKKNGPTCSKKGKRKIAPLHRAEADVQEGDQILEKTSKINATRTKPRQNASEPFRGSLTLTQKGKRKYRSMVEKS